jgi:hypothetical protein
LEHHCVSFSQKLGDFFPRVLSKAKSVRTFNFSLSSPAHPS